MQGIFQEIMKHSEPLVENLGYEMGREFGKRFRQYLKGKYPTTDLEIDLQIEKWCKYDMNAGLGLFENKVVINAGEIISGEIQLKHSFLTEDRSCEDKNLCVFMEGYIEGVLNRIGNRRDDVIQVEHKYCDLDYPGKPNLGCRFLITDSRQEIASSNLISDDASS